MDEIVSPRLRQEHLACPEYPAAWTVDLRSATGRRPTRSRQKSTYLAGLEAISSLPGLGRRILVYLGRERLTKSGSIEVLPFAQFVDLLETREI